MNTQITLLTRKEIACLFSVTPGTVKNWEKKNLIKPNVRINGRPKYLQEDVRRLANLDKLSLDGTKA
ncbi:MerR HTH family regulatory protein [Cnuella takakiae]|uniref:MerR HTH family regulatory protein n=1 Tax=Cnuella takakiae TaxID=1302690 RepID=A0A1M5ELB2_9BACT|nr:MerR family transcriptional regulator [Cnuella takakiae]OLY91217.1 hypothetical protein BUE76_04355 [Cnuella takakiae]SHF79966.1 MerR HTH family regulatory protein [Cnuella takakiae]